MAKHVADAALHLAVERVDAGRGTERLLRESAAPLLLLDDVLDGAAVGEHGVRHGPGFPRSSRRHGHQHDVVDDPRGDAVLGSDVREHTLVAGEVVVEAVVREVGDVDDVVARPARAHEGRQRGEGGAVDHDATGVGRLALEGLLGGSIIVVRERRADEVEALGVALLTDDVHLVAKLGEGAEDGARPEIGAGAGEAVAVNESEGHRGGGRERRGRREGRT